MNNPGDPIRRNALRRNISARLHDASDSELEAIDRVLVAIEKRRDILDDLGIDRSVADDRARSYWDDRIEEKLRALRAREAAPHLTVLDGGER